MTDFPSANHVLPLRRSRSLDLLKPKYEQEKAQLQGELPVLLELKALIASLLGPASPPSATESAVGGHASSLARFNSLVASLVPPSTDNKVASNIKSLKQQLAVSAGSSQVSGKAHAVVDQLMAEMSVRIAELDKMLKELTTELSDNQVS